MSLKVYIDGELVDKADAKVSVYDHGLLYGDGVFEGIRVYNGKVWACDEHLERLWASARAIRLDVPIPREKMAEAIEQTVKANGFKDCYIRVVVTRGVGNLGIDPRKCKAGSVIVIADTINVYPPEMYTKGISVIVPSIVRNHPNALSARIKSLNYLNNILARIEANDAGAWEAVMLNHEGSVAECTADNIFIVRGGGAQTPMTSDGILEGVTRATILGLCGKLGIPCMEKRLLRQDLYAADECFVCGTGAEIMPVTQIDRRTVGGGEPGPITKRLTEAYFKLVRGG